MGLISGKSEKSIKVIYKPNPECNITSKLKFIVEVINVLESDDINSGLKQFWNSIYESRDILIKRVLKHTIFCEIIPKINEKTAEISINNDIIQPINVNIHQNLDMKVNSPKNSSPKCEVYPFNNKINFSNLNIEPKSLYFDGNLIIYIIIFH